MFLLKVLTLSKMKVSVIIPTYNREKYICEAIESVLGQTMEDIEIIVVDDGSTDNTSQRIKPYQKKIKYIYTENGGPAHARNIGITRAKGEYISFLDSDDLYYPYKTQSQTAILDKYSDIGMVCTEFSGFDDKDFWDEFHLKKYHESAYRNGRQTYDNIFLKSISLAEAGLHFEKRSHRKIYMGHIFDEYIKNLIVFTNSVMLRREVLKTVGLQDEQYWLFEEYDFILRITKQYPVAFLDLPTYKLRYHVDQISDTHGSDGPEIRIKKQANLLRIVKKHAMEDADYYFNHKALVDEKVGGLHRSLAIPLMATGKNSRLAREHLVKSLSYGRHCYFLWLLTYTPHIIRRIAFKLIELMKRIKRFLND
jgi:glycosyltransferase involved in cell wall biosynthesis